MVSPVQKALLFAVHPPASGNRLMIERGIGYWISDEGAFVPLPPRVSHADLMREVISDAALDDEGREAFLVDPNMWALTQGWTRVRIYPGENVAYVDYGEGARRDHARLVSDLMDELGLPGVRVKFTDEDGNYVSP